MSRSQEVDRGWVVVGYPLRQAFIRGKFVPSNVNNYLVTLVAHYRRT